MPRITLAIVTTFAMLFLGAPQAHAEDTAGTLAAMPSKAAEQLYLTRLCDRVGVAEKRLFDAMDGVVDCKQRSCADGAVDKAMVSEEAAQRVHANSFGAYEDAASAYRVKRHVDAHSCAATNDASGAH